MSFKPKILRIRQLAIGDILLITSILKQIQVGHAGDCEIDVQTMKPEAFVRKQCVRRQRFLFKFRRIFRSLPCFLVTPTVFCSGQAANLKFINTWLEVIIFNA